METTLLEQVEAHLVALETRLGNTPDADKAHEAIVEFSHIVRMIAAAVDRLPV